MKGQRNGQVDRHRSRSPSIAQFDIFVLHREQSKSGVYPHIISQSKFVISWNALYEHKVKLVWHIRTSPRNLYVFSMKRYGTKPSFDVSVYQSYTCNLLYRVFEIYRTTVNHYLVFKE